MPSTTLLSQQRVIFVLAEPGQTFKVFVSLKRPSSISWPEGSTHLQVAGSLDGDFHVHSKFISRQNLAAFLAHAEDSPDEVQLILDGLLEQNIVYSERRRPSFSKTVVQLQQTDPTSWTSQAGLVEVEVAAGKLVQLPGRKLAKSEPATVKCGEECKPFNTPALRVVPSVAVCHSEATPKPHDQQGQQAIAGRVAKVSESSAVIPQPAKASPRLPLLLYRWCPMMKFAIQKPPQSLRSARNSWSGKSQRDIHCHASGSQPKLLQICLCCFTSGTQS